MRSIDVDLEMKLGPSSRVRTNKVLKYGGIFGLVWVVSNMRV